MHIQHNKSASEHTRNISGAHPPPPPPPPPPPQTIQSQHLTPYCGHDVQNPTQVRKRPWRYIVCSIINVNPNTKYICS